MVRLLHLGEWLREPHIFKHMRVSASVLFPHVRVTTRPSSPPLVWGHFDGDGGVIRDNWILSWTVRSSIDFKWVLKLHVYALSYPTRCVRPCLIWLTFQWSCLRRWVIRGLNPLSVHSCLSLAWGQVRDKHVGLINLYFYLFWNHFDLSFQWFLGWILKHRGRLGLLYLEFANMRCFMLSRVPIEGKKKTD